MGRGIVLLYTNILNLWVQLPIIGLQMKQTFDVYKFIVLKYEKRNIYHCLCGNNVLFNNKITLFKRYEQ